MNFGDGYVEITPTDAPPSATPSSTYASDDCAGGPVIIEAASGPPNWNGAADVRVRYAQPNDDTSWLCVRSESVALRLGGKFVVTSGSGGVQGLPATDTDHAACTTTAGNTVPGAHPILSGEIGDPNEPETYAPYLLDAYSGPAGAWVCLRVGDAKHRIVISAPGVDLPASIAFVADPPAPQTLFTPESTGLPSGQCLQGFDVPAGASSRVAGNRVFLYSIPSPGGRTICVRVEGVASVGGALFVAEQQPGTLIPQTSTTDMTPCTTQVLHNNNPVVTVRRSAVGAFPASICLTVGDASQRITVGSPGDPLTDVTWTPDPGTPGLP